jgi:hypothetical protein
MIHALVPFVQLTRFGVPPEFRVCRLPLLISSQEIAVGEVVATDSIANRSRVRQLYEQRRIEPLTPAKTRAQAAKERMERAVPSVCFYDPSTDLALQRLTAADVLDAPSIQVAEENELPVPTPTPVHLTVGRRGYKPLRGVKSL